MRPKRRGGFNKRAERITDFEAIGLQNSEWNISRYDVVLAKVYRNDHGYNSDAVHYSLHSDHLRRPHRFKRKKR